MPEPSNTQTAQPPATPATPASPATGVVNPTPLTAEEVEILGKLVAEKANAKYEGDRKKAIDGLAHSEAKMHEATTEKAEIERRVQELERELELAKAQPQVSQGFSSQPAGQPSDAERARVEAEYGRPYEEVVAQFKIAQMAQLPTLEMLSNIQLKDIKQNIKATDPNFTEAVEKEFDSLIRQRDPRDRTNPFVYRDCIERAKGKLIDVIVRARVEEQLKTFTGGQPVPPPSATVPTGQVPTTPKKCSIDELTVSRIANSKYGNMNEESLAKVREMYSE